MLSILDWISDFIDNIATEVVRDMMGNVSPMLIFVPELHRQRRYVIQLDDAAIDIDSDSDDATVGLTVQELVDATQLVKGLKSECAICLGSRRNTLCRRLRTCRHCFHVKCIDQWLSKHRKCPLCRSDLGRQIQ